MLSVWGNVLGGHIDWTVPLTFSGTKWGQGHKNDAKCPEMHGTIPYKMPVTPLLRKTV